MSEMTIELSLPADVAAALLSHRRGEIKTEERITSLLAIGLFAEGTITLARAASLARMSRFEFALYLKQIGLPAYEYTQSEYEEDLAFGASISEG
jgi:predicted HTH domain antitoxin